MKAVSKKAKVVAVIVTYNRKELLREAIEAILMQDYKDCDVLIVDNASTDGTREYVADLARTWRVTYLNTSENLGGAGGFNFGMRKAVELGYEYVWLMDDDCIVRNDSLTKFFEADKKLQGKYGFLSSKVLWSDGTPCVMNRQKRTFSKWLNDYDTDLQKIAMASFVSMFLKTSTIKKYGLPIRDFFIWTDDWEFSRRISRKLPCYFVADSVVTHKCKENIGASIAAVDGERMERFKYLYRNDVVLYRREGVAGWTLLYLRLLLHTLRVLKSSKGDKKARLKIMRKAIKEGKRFRPSIEYPTRELKNVFVVSTYYHILISVIKAMRAREKYDLMIVVFDKSTLELAKNRKMLERLRNAKIFNGVKVVDFDGRIYRKMRKPSEFVGQLRVAKRNRAKMAKLFKPYYKVFIFNDMTIFGRTVNFAKVQYVLLEDGIDCFAKNYKFIQKGIVKRTILKIFYGYGSMGSSKNIDYVEVNNCDSYELSRPMTVCNKAQLFGSLSSKELGKIFDVFDAGVQLKKQCTLLLTQPFYDDGYLLKTREDQLALYKYILDFYAENENVVIKVHPRETVDYRAIKGVTILNKDFPVELFSMMPEAKFDKIITIDSSAIGSFTNCERKIELGRGWLMEYVKEHEHGQA